MGLHLYLADGGPPRTGKVSDLSKSGLHAVQAIDPVAGMDIAWAKQSVNGELVGASNAVVIETPLDNYQKVIQAWKDVAGY